MPAVQGLRPTGDRVRETLFNWLQADVAGSHCLDLFAGSGALGLEALSRYAASTTFIEPDSLASKHLRQSLTTLGCSEGLVEQDTAQRFLARDTRQFDIVFVDPPFDLQIQWSVVDTLLAGHLAPSAWLYVESPAGQLLPDEGIASCELHREKRFGDVCARLLRCEAT